MPKKAKDITKKGLCMNYEIQPKYNHINVKCSCGYETTVGTTLEKELHIEHCSSCHPFYSGEQKGPAAGGRIDRFNRRLKQRAKKSTE